MTLRTATVNGAALRYEVAGDGPPVVLIHGFSFDLRSWNHQFARLAQRHTVLRYDLRGFGASPPPDRPYSHIEDLAGLLRVLRLAPAHLVGLSLGANVALGCAVAHPAMVRSLVLVSAGLAGHPWREERPPDAAANHARQHGVEGAKAFWLAHPLFASAADHPRARAMLERMVADYSGWHWQHPNPMVPFDVTAKRLGAVAAATLVVSGGLDVAGYREIAELLAAGIPGARKLDFLEAGHVLPLEVPEEFNAAIEAFHMTGHIA